MTITGKVALVAAACVLLTGCGGGGGHTVDTKAWRAELKDQGVNVTDWSKYQAVWESECKESADDLALGLTLKGFPPARQVRMAFKYQCPDQLDKLDKAYASIAESQSNVDDACGTPASERTEQQSELAEAMGC